ncbi:oligopeptidase A [Coccomyxa subellipsoidea C-169]|uniref:oligopeptidase A n=1 Tax=Coccomyxa subellipsoidea (strain C-169) TaxID=574566 RepID=I0Z0V1_COCSC|nr:oligopeptidase A [Coccomyxa subellipsoidea C-169]EIE24270.1 oligopeptidase A [Coccomyxa subellipsoidea C-169]|eukprot:XP_005648814.1 oligopeptidase A [Coccomyxa subellipsoidea C-169]
MLPPYGHFRSRRISQAQGAWLCLFLVFASVAGAARRPLEYVEGIKTAEASADAKEDPLLASTVFPLYDKLTAASIVPSLMNLFKELEQDIDKLEASAPTTWADLVDPYERLNDRLNLPWGIVTHLEGVKNNDELRAAMDQLNPLQVRISQRLGQSSPLYQAFKIIRNNSTGLTEAQQRVLDGAIINAKLSGVDLQVEATDRFNEITQQLSALSNNFSNNALDSTAAFKLLVTDKKGLGGLPESFLAQAAQRANKAGNDGATPADGPWLITLDAPTYTSVMSYADNRTLREEVYRAYISRASSGAADNTPIIETMMALRQEQARLAGYTDAAEYFMANKMATPQTAMDLVEQLREASYNTAAKELKDLRQFAASQNFTETLMNWDSAYWAQKQQQALFNLNDEDVRPYLPLPRVLEGLFALAKRLFNATVEAADGEVPVWDPTVRFFRVYRNGDLKAHFYLDSFARPGEKSAGAWQSSMVGQSALLAAPGEKLRLPVAVLVTNQSPPVGDKPSLMTMYEVVTLFHEFGHGLQHMLTTQTDVLVSGIAGIEQDAVEQPSQFLERWAHEKPVLLSFARHYETNKSMPEDLVNKIEAARNYRSGTDTLRQLYYALIDLKIHSSYNPQPGVFLHETDLYKDVIAKTNVMAPLPEDRFLCTFTHIFSGGYASGYYGYKWAQVMSIDGFSAFQEVGMDNEEAIAKEGLKYRDTILSLGGARAPALVFQDFRGRPSSTTPILRDENLLQADTGSVQTQSLVSAATSQRAN